MTEWSRSFVQPNNLKISYHRSGAGSNKPAIVLLHGFTDNGLCWSPVARDLEETYDVIMPDARGHGQSEGPGSSLATGVLADDAAAVIRELGLDKPYLFGHSMGAITALAVAAKYPELVRAIIMEDPPLIDPRPITPEEEQQLRQRMQEGKAFHDLPLAERIERGKAQNPGWSEAEILPWATSKGEYNPEILERREGIRDFPWREGLSTVKCPALLITAETAKGAIVSPEIAREAAQLNPQCQVAFISGAGHSIHRDRYSETMQAVLNFLGKH
ncbi:MAG TPA: alpha/beta hydrolase [Chloroflexia bacterium]|nr:alpha/beta hydrolase [Chloroflexia bacterium]